MKYIVSILILSIILASCEAFLFESNKASTDPLVNFDYLWNEIDKKYSYFELKNINWDEVGERYRAELSEDSDEEELFSVLAAMMNELRDDHSNLVAPFNVSRYNLMLKKPANYNKRTIDEYYLENSKSTGVLKHGSLAGGQIAYVRYGSFSDVFSSNQLDYVLKHYQNTKGLILDVRENGGGYLSNVPALLERFALDPQLVGYFITRNGEKHTDFSEPKEFHVESGDGLQYFAPVVVLTDRGSYSATTFFSVAAKALHNITLIGDTTGGGGGMPNGGQLPNGWTYRFSVTQLLDTAMNNFAEDGVPPDIAVLYDWDDISRDEILDTAIDYLLGLY
jgi:C-terminal processing protease CtpA/Prc